MNVEQHINQRKIKAPVKHTFLCFSAFTSTGAFFILKIFSSFKGNYAGEALKSYMFNFKGSNGPLTHDKKSTVNFFLQYYK